MISLIILITYDISWEPPSHHPRYAPAISAVIKINLPTFVSKNKKQKRREKIEAAGIELKLKEWTQATNGIWHKSVGFPKGIEKKIQFNILLLLSKIGIWRHPHIIIHTLHRRQSPPRTKASEGSADSGANKEWNPCHSVIVQMPLFEHLFYHHSLRNAMRITNNFWGSGGWTDEGNEEHEEVILLSQEIPIRIYGKKGREIFQVTEFLFAPHLQQIRHAKALHIRRKEDIIIVILIIWSYLPLELSSAKVSNKLKCLYRISFSQF